MSGCKNMNTLSDKDLEALTQTVMATERAFANTMAVRDHEAFTRFLSDDAIFFSNCKPTRGKSQVAALWEGLFKNPDAPFSWEPEIVEVTGSGDLAISSGPVYAPDGKVIGRFTSIWKQEEPGVWRIVFDKGDEDCK